MVVWGDHPGNDRVRYLSAQTRAGFVVLNGLSPKIALRKEKNDDGFPKTYKEKVRSIIAFWKSINRKAKTNDGKAKSNDGKVKSIIAFVKSINGKAKSIIAFRKKGKEKATLPCGNWKLSSHENFNIKHPSLTSI